MKLQLILGIVLIASIIIIYGMVVFEMKKLPIDYRVISEHEGQDQILETIGGKLSESFWIRETLIQEAVNANDNVLEIRSTITGVDSSTNSIIFDREDTFFVDRTSRKHQDTDDYFTFPTNVQKINYEFFHPMIFTKTIFAFEKTRNIDGLEVYDFTCHYEKTDVTHAFPQFSSHTILSDGNCSVSVEPVTGMMVSFSKEWDDYFIDDDVRGAQVEIGGKHTTEYSEIILVENAKSAKSLYYLLDVIFPVLILAIGGATLIAVIFFVKTRNQAMTIIKTQNEMLKKERLSTIGKITAQLSHDLRTSLSIIKMSSEAMQMRLEKNIDPKIEEHIPRINQAMSRILYQINQVLGFVKTMSFNMKLVSLSAILDDALKHIDIPKDIVVTLPSDDYSLMADRIHLSIAFGNLLSNAVDAIDTKGSITIRARVEENNLILEFEDSGVGISKKDIKQIFEPLFTTKPQGIGLGLSSIDDIIKAHGGTISVTSPPTVFKITLPLE